MKKLRLYVRVLLFVLMLTIPCISQGGEADTCKSGDSPSRWYLETAGDFEGEDGGLFWPFYLGKFLFPIKHADCDIERFFRDQDLDFGSRFSDAEVSGRMSMSAAGDIMVRKHINGKTAAHLYDDVADELFGADIVFGNLESPTVPSKASHAFPSYNMSSETLNVSLGLDRDKGFMIVATANNHALDQGEQGLLATLDYLDELGIEHVGTSRSPNQRDNDFPIIDQAGIKVAFLAYTFSTNGRPVPEGREYTVNFIRLNSMSEKPDISLIKKHISTVHSKGADVVVVSLHWSVEHEFYPPQRIIELGHRIADAGADIILGHHPHVINPIERYVPQARDQGLPEVLIAYSLGNFLPDHYQVEQQTSIILQVDLARAMLDDKEIVFIENVDYTPFWWYCIRLSGKRDYRLINVERALEDGRDHPRYQYLKPRHWRELEAARRIIKEQFELQKN